MFKLYKNMVYKDKTVNNPILGQINCIALCGSYQQCYQKRKKLRTQHDECQQLYITCDKCYSSDSKQQFNQWIMKQYEQSTKLIAYLRERRSDIPDQLLKNSWGIFTKAQNLVKYRDVLREQEQEKLLSTKIESTGAIAQQNKNK